MKELRNRITTEGIKTAVIINETDLERSESTFVFVNAPTAP